MRGAVAEGAALDGARRREEPGGVLDLVLLVVEDDADLVRQDLLALAHLLERRRVDDLVELRDEEELREDGELLHEVALLVLVRVALAEPLAEGVALHDRVARHNGHGLVAEGRPVARHGADLGRLERRRGERRRARQEGEKNTHIEGSVRGVVLFASGDSVSGRSECPWE